ncbi:glutamate--tRNA ligase [bacterium]|nr:glutamate--tRNA ligase [bacterium]
MSQSIRTRFAPSPTGHLHIGNARTALMNWLAARHFGGRFILRIEDTDRERSTEASEQSILGDMAWLGLDWDEGPDKGGEYGPYRQSERLVFYQEIREQLIASGHAYPCFCTAEDLEARRQEQLGRGEQPHYDGRCRHLSAEEKIRFETAGRQPSTRFHVQKESVSFRDLVKGEITVQKEALSDFVIVRPDGMPMYNFACMADDHHMAISHVIRGDDHVSNTHRQILMYEALQWEIPEFAHIPMILGQDRDRLSKRHGATSVTQFQEAGYLPDALLNFLSLLSWSSGSGEEILSRDRLVQEFGFDRVSRSASVFDTEKLDWMNGVYIREKTDFDTLARLALPFFRQAGYPVNDAAAARPVVRALQSKMEKLSEIGDKARIFFLDEAVPEDNEAAETINGAEPQAVFRAFLSATEGLPAWDSQMFMTVMKQIQQSTGIKGKGLWMPVRVALTGQMHGPELGPVTEILGLDLCRRRIQQAIG